MAGIINKTAKIHAIPAKIHTQSAVAPTLLPHSPGKWLQKHQRKALCQRRHEIAKGNTLFVGERVGQQDGIGRSLGAHHERHTGMIAGKSL